MLYYINTVSLYIFIYLPLSRFEAIEASISLLMISFLDCSLVLVMLPNKVRLRLIISSFDLTSFCRCLIWLLSLAFDFTTKSYHLDLKNLNSLSNNLLMSSCKLYSILFLNFTILLFSLREKPIYFNY